MKMLKKGALQRACLIAGICLLVAGAVLLIAWQWSIQTAQKRAETYVSALRTLLPETQGAVPESRRDNTMSVLSLYGKDFVGILEMPGYGSSLPVGAKWGKSTQYPCRFSGSVYDRTLKIGATAQKGQYDFYREISAGDVIYFTDMEGNRFAYTVTDLRYEKHADQDALEQQPAALVLFIKNPYAFEYLILFCEVA